MRVLLSGASGFVGANVLDYMLEYTSWTFVAPCSWRHKGTPSRISRVLCTDEKRRRVKVVSMDLRHPIPDMGEFDAILNLASESHVDRSIANPVAFIENNVSVALQMLEYARLHPCRRFIQFSTDEVFGPDGEGPSSPYAASKAAQESIANAYRRTYGVPVVITNSSNIIGPMQDAEKFVPRVITAVRNGDEVLAIHQHNGVVGSRFYDAVDNVASALMHLAEGGTGLGHYQLGPGAELTNLEMAQRIADALELPLHYRMVEVGSLRPGYDQHYHHMGLPLVGWSPVVSFDEGLARAVGLVEGV